VNQPVPVELDTDTLKTANSLAERLDPSIGEVTTAVGAMLTELLRRSLRGGVTRIGEELDGYVSERVDATLAERTPAIEQAAAEVAEHTARTAATEIAVEEVRALEGRTRQAGRELATKIEETAKTALIAAADTARDLTGKIEQMQRQAEEVTAAKARELEGKIEETEKRVTETTQAKMDQELQTLVQSSRKGTEALKARMKVQEEALQSLESKLLQQLKQTEMERRKVDDHFRTELVKLVAVNHALTTRIVELEKPRGLRAFFARLFGRKKKQETVAANA
jgi:chromosome segregation ATPase